MKLNKRGDLRGIYGEGKGREGYGWDLFKHGELVGTYKTLKEVGAAIGFSAIYVWQMVHGKTGRPKYYKHTPHTTSEGYQVRKSKS